MKQNIFKLILIAVISLTVYNCQKDDEFNTDIVVKNNITVEHISSKNLDTKIASRITEKASIIQKTKKLQFLGQGKFEYNTDLDIYIDLDNGKLVNNNGEIYYTYPMYRVNEDNLENIVFAVLDNGELEAYFVKYNVSPREFSELSIDEQQNLTPQFQKTSADSEYLCVEFIQTITVYGECTETHSNGYTCGNETTTYTTSFCSWTSGGGGFDQDTGNDGFNNNTNDTTNQNDSTTSGTYNGGGSNSGISTTPISLQPWEEVDICLNQVSETGSNGYTQEMSAWLQTQPKSTVGQINSFISEENCSQEAQDSIIEIIEAMMLNPDAAFEDFFLEIDYDNDKKIDNIAKELECFDSTLPAQLTIYAEQCIENSRQITARLGHTFIGIEQNGVIRNVGFYPDESGAANLFGSQGSEIHDNSSSPFHVSITIDIDSTQLINVINYIENYSSTYDLGSYNCTDFGIAVAALGNINLPSTLGTATKWGITVFEGANPSDLGEDMREYTLPLGATRNTESGNAPERTENCTN